MSPEERQLIAGLFDRTQSASSQPRDREAEALIADAVRQQPYAPYLLAQTVIVQEQALRAANDRLGQLEAQVRDIETKASKSQSSGFLGGLGGLFGGGAAAVSQRPGTSPPPSGPWGGAPAGGGNWNGAPQGSAPQGNWGGPQGGYAQQQPMQGGGGGGFLKGALGAAAGVAGGVLLADSIRGLFHGGNNPMGIGSGFSPGLGGSPAAANYDDGGYASANDDGGYSTASTDDGGYNAASGNDAGVSNAGYDDGGFGSSDDDGGYDA